MTVPATRTRLAALLAAHDAYRPARQRFISALGKSVSTRDPLAELSEQLVAALMHGSPAAGHVQPSHDVALPDRTRVHVRYLANPPSVWINEHLVHRIPGVERYALVLFENFDIVGVVAFPTDNLAQVCAALGKRHGRQHETLQFTRRNWHTIRDETPRFRRLGVQVWLPPIDLTIPDQARPTPFRRAALRTGADRGGPERRGGLAAG
jgi:hypothetical protein